MSHADRERAVARRVATGLVVVFVALWIVRLILGIATGSLTDQPSLPSIWSSTPARSSSRP